MIFIAHRGNTNGRNPKLENHPVYLFEALDKGYEVEADIWFDHGWWSGHDEPQYKIKCDHLRFFWCHVKNTDAFRKLINIETRDYFWHQNDDYTLTSLGHIWVYPGKPLIKNSICVMPELGFDGDLKKCYGICSDTVSDYKKII